jgi:arylsulfatase A
MKTKSILPTSLPALLSLSLALSVNAAGPTNARPNIIFILADDFGIGNVSCYGADDFKTPNVDALAISGLRFNHCYASPLCGPTRALLMTGR